MFNTKRFIQVITFSLIAGLAPLQASQAGIGISFNNGGHHSSHNRHQKKYSKSYGRKSGHYYNRHGKRYAHNSPYYHNRHGKRFSHKYSRHQQVRTCEEVVVRSHYEQPYVVGRKCYLKPYSGHYNTGNRVIHKRFLGRPR
jgi:hypothetical protein